MKDKDGKKLEIGSIVATRKPGKERFTVRGTVIGSDDQDNIIFTDISKGHRRVVPSLEIKRIRYRPRRLRR
ncbi:MAG: hypothetical protein SVK08_00925 [Halobacteriota archaeon]|nr:hypothetical protein [Halobacteriota archaeon]